MPLEAKASALVAGSNPGGAGAAEVEVQVVRAFCIRGERQEPGSVIRVAPTLARELVYIGKASATIDKKLLPKVAKAKGEKDAGE